MKGKNIVNYDADYEIAKRWMIKSLGFYLDVMDITPDIAKNILDKKGANRNISNFRVSKYSEMMKKGQWKFTYQGIAFDERGQLSDGQHRLKAVVVSKMPQKFLAFHDVPRENPCDVGFSRRDYDDLAFRGILDSDQAKKEIFSMLKALLRVCAIGGGKNITSVDMAAFIKKYKNEIYFAKKTAGTGTTHGVGAKAPVRAAILAAVLCGVDLNLLKDFATVLNTGFVVVDSEIPIEGQRGAIVLHETLIKFRKVGGGGGGSRTAITEKMAEEAIRDFVQKKPRSKEYAGKTNPFSAKLNIEEMIESASREQAEKQDKEEVKE